MTTSARRIASEILPLVAVATNCGIIFGFTYTGISSGIGRIALRVIRNFVLTVFVRNVNKSHASLLLRKVSVPRTEAQ